MVTALRIAFMYLLEADKPASILTMRSTMTLKRWDLGSVFQGRDPYCGELGMARCVEVCVTWDPLLGRCIRKRPES